MKRVAMNRRAFLGTTVAAGASLPCFIPADVFGGAKQPGANEKVNVGIIGLGGRACAGGQYVLRCPGNPHRGRVRLFSGPQQGFCPAGRKRSKVEGL